VRKRVGNAAGPDVDGAGIGGVEVGGYRWLIWQREVGLAFGDEVGFGFIF
jgi:hypothetical protein